MGTTEKFCNYFLKFPSFVHCFISFMMWTVIAAVTVVYAGTSFVFLKKPTLLHRKKKLAFYCRHISHRGGAGENVENTMGAFRHAVEACRTDMLEIDCQRTADDEIVVSHDNHLLRATGIDANISDLSFSELPEYLTDLPLQFNKFLRCEIASDADRRIPLLRELFENFPKLPINIDIKEDDEKLIDQVNGLIKEFEREDITVWGNYRDSVCQKCYAKVYCSIK